MAVTALLLAQVLPRPRAQGAATAAAAGRAGPAGGGDPPERVGRLARVSGTVSFHAQDEDQWNPATANYPVSAGNAFWTEPNAQADDRGFRQPHRDGARHRTRHRDAERYGLPGDRSRRARLYLRVRAATPNETYAVQTPRGLVTLTSPGRYGVVAGDTQTPTTVTVVEGSAQSRRPPSCRSRSAPVRPPRSPAATLSRAMSVRRSVTRSSPRCWTANGRRRRRRWHRRRRLRRCRAARTSRCTAPGPTARNTARSGIRRWRRTGCRIAMAVGPMSRLGAGPGWTASLGLRAVPLWPLGRAGGRWGWYPGAGSPSPVYAPALVTFFGVGAVVGIGIGAALAGGRIGWCPLGPREAYRPWYRASDRYVRQVNITHVTNFTTINRNVTINNFVNRGAATVVPTSALTASRPVRPRCSGSIRRSLHRRDRCSASSRCARTNHSRCDAGGRPSVGLAAVIPGPAQQRAGTHVPCHAGWRLDRSRGRGGIGRPALAWPRNPEQPNLPAAAGLTRPLTAAPALRAPAPGRSGRRRYSGSRVWPARVPVRRSIAVAAVRPRQS